MSAATLFEGARLQMTDSIRLTIESLQAYGAVHEHWAVAWSGGKDSTCLVTLVVWLILSGKVAAPKTLTVLYADTRLELPPLWHAANTIREELDEKREALAALGCALDVRTVVAPLDKRFLVYVLGRGVPPPNNNTLRWCTRQIKVDPMRAELARLMDGRGDVLTLTGVRLGESAARDARIALSCSKGDGECGQGWYQRDLADRGQATLAPILHWRICHVWEWLDGWAPREDHGDWSTRLLARAYGGRDGDEAAELAARTGCSGCPLATVDTARAAADRTPLRRTRHLLVGYAVCDACGGPVATARTREGRESVPAYLCAWRRDRGPEVCTARWTRSVARLDALVLDWIGREVLSPDLVADVAAEARRLAEEPQPACDLDGLRAEERTLAATVARLTLALETAPDVPELAARLRSQSDRLRAVRRELSAATRPATPPGLDVALVEGAARLRELLARDTAAARDVLALVLDGRLRVRWEGPRRPVWITGAAELRAELSTQGTLASPEGYGRPLRRVTLRRAA